LIMSTLPRTWSWLGAVGLFFVAAPGFAQGATSAAAAEALFNEARSLVIAKNFAQACPKFAESQRLDPGTGTLMNLADCYEKGGLLASAWTTWIEAARSAKAAGQADREAHARKAAAALEPRLAHLSLQVPVDHPEGMTLKRNGLELAPATWGTPLPVDKGRYRIEASAPGFRSSIVEAVVEDGQAHNLLVPRLIPLGPDATPEAASLTPVAASPEPTSTTPDQATPARPGHTQRTLGVVALGIGGAGVTAGAIFGIVAIALNAESKTHCDVDDPNSCSSVGVDHRNQALVFGDVSTVAFAVGGALAAGGLILVLTAPKARAEVSLAPTWGGCALSYGGKF
jgi:hypothetical protein